MTRILCDAALIDGRVHVLDHRNGSLLRVLSPLNAIQADSDGFHIGVVTALHRCLVFNGSTGALIRQIGNSKVVNCCLVEGLLTVSFENGTKRRYWLRQESLPRANVYRRLSNFFNAAKSHAAVSPRSGKQSRDR